jgi:hypothetical protein
MPPAAARHATRRNSPLNDEPLTGREVVAEAIQTVYTLGADLTYKEALSGETHHAALFRLQIEDTVVDRGWTTRTLTQLTMLSRQREQSSTSRRRSRARRQPPWPASPAG